jgi:NTE family protein/lysophospholipid hydrolase
MIITETRRAIAKAVGMAESDEDGFLDAFMSSLAPVSLRSGDTLITQSEAVDSLWLVESGQLEGHGGLGSDPVELGGFGPGQIVAVSLLPASGPSLLTVTATTDAILGRLTLSQAEAVRRSWPSQMAAISELATARATFLSLILGLRQSILFANLDLPTTMELARKAKQLVFRAGETLLRQGDPSDAIYVVINGRLDAMKRLPDGRGELLNPIGPGESVGEIGLVADQPRPADVVARRDTTVAYLTKADYLEALRLNPEGTAKGLVRAAQGMSTGTVRFRRRHRGNLPSLALLASKPGMPLRESANALVEALGRRGSIIALSSAFCADAGYPINEETQDAPERNLAMLRWINDLERRFSCVLYVADDYDSPWTQLCVRQADNVLLMVDGSAPPEVGPIERSVNRIQGPTRRQWTILLIQPPDLSVPSSTAAHLGLRQVDTHMHVRAGNEADWARVARFLTGHSVGVVFGGGGARGFAHVGVIRALEEHGVPIDMVGGSSIGALIAGQYGLGWGAEEVLAGLIKLVRQGEQFTLPLVSLMSGRRFSKGLHALFGDVTIEDMWRRFFCASCNLTRAESIIHTRGDLWRAVLASNSPPGLFPPVVKDGDLLFDGGLLDGLPIEAMNNLNSGGLLIVIDVKPRGGVSTSYSYDYGISGWRILWSRLNPFTRSVVMPNIIEILTQSMSIGSSANRRLMLKRATDLLLELPLSNYSVTDHGKGEEIAERGYFYTHESIGNWWMRQPKL